MGSIRQPKHLEAILVLRVVIAALLIWIGFGSISIDRAVDDWRAMYPDDPAHRTALYVCYENNRGFNRMSGKARADCYSRWLPTIEARRQAREHGVTLW